MNAVNLLPQAYIKAQARRRRIRIGTALAAVLLSTELFAGLMLHARAGRTRELQAAAQAAREETQTAQQKMKVPAQEEALLGQQLSLARKLRTRHRWSRLLSVFSEAASSRVMLTAICTDPPKWSPALGLSETTPVAAKAGAEAPALLAGLNVRGVAGDYDDLTRFISQLQKAGAFASLSLKDARRDKHMERDVVSFELQCRW